MAAAKPKKISSGAEGSHDDAFLFEDDFWKCLGLINGGFVYLIGSLLPVTSLL